MNWLTLGGSCSGSLVVLLAATLLGPWAHARQADTSGVAIALHGGAGTITREAMTPEKEAAYRAMLGEALAAGHAVLQQGGSSLDAVVAAIRLLEDSPLFNAGRGAVFTSERTVELDASIMDGATRQAGAITGVRHVRHPIELARQVMEHSPHVMLVGDGAEAFARQQGLEMVDNGYFQTEERLRQLERAQERERAGDTGAVSAPPAPGMAAPGREDKFGTVGVVALDSNGNLAAGTSTGGMTNKRFGRVGDSPIIGAGTYADNETCAVSATGHGEYFIRAVVAHDIAAQMRYLGRSLQDAVRSVILEKLTEMGGTGGVIAMDRQGNIAMPFNTPGMYRGYIDTRGHQVVEIYQD